ncbi:MAG: molybdate ABC transporter substrate-binding protein [Vicinamibacteria bacterium]
MATDGDGMHRREWLRRLAAAGAPCLLPLAPGAAATAAAQAPPRVAAAADLRVALTELAARFEAAGQGRVSLVFGASGTLARQIVDGAPFELFLSADEAYVRQVVAARRAPDEGTLYAVGRLALFAPSGSPLRVDAECAGLRQLVGGTRPFRFAIANPAHAPYGRAAEAVLRHHGLWTALQPSLVLGENVAQAAQFAAGGSTVGGLIAHALAIAPPLARQGTHTLIPAAHHPPLRQRLVLLAGAGSVSRRFRDFVLGQEGRGLLARYGFGPPPP